MMDGAAEIAEILSHQIEALARELLPGGHREGQEWRCGSLAGEAGYSLGVHLTGAKEAQVVKTSANNGWQEEIDYFLRCIESGKRPTVTTPKDASA